MEDIKCEDIAVDAGKEEPGEAAQTDSSTVRAFLIVNVMFWYSGSLLFTPNLGLFVCIDLSVLTLSDCSTSGGHI